MNLPGVHSWYLIRDQFHNAKVILLGFLGGSDAKNLPAMQENQVPSLGREDPPEKDLATHSRILAGESHGQRSLVGCSPWSRKELGMTEAT